jgi:hypothetical protein
MDNSHNFIYSCSNCTYKFHISNLKTDWFDVNKLLCHDCNTMRSCDLCSKILPLSWFHKDDCDSIICKDCYNYDIHECERCNKYSYSKQLNYCKNVKQNLCERCYYYNFILFIHGHLDDLHR